MQRYIQQLIEDFNNAEAHPVKEQDFDNSSEQFENLMEQFTKGERKDAKQQLGVSYDELPPADRMTIEQTQELTIAMLNAINAKGTHVHFPGDGIPAKLAYTELREQFKDGFHALPGWTIDFCSGNCEDCTFVDYCSMKTEHEQESKK